MKICPDHQKELVFYCISCTTLVCQDCIASEHEEHDYLVPKERTPREEQTDPNFKSIRKEEKDLENLSYGVKIRIEEVKEQGVQVIKKMEEKIKKLQEALEERKAELLDEVERLVKEKVDTLSFQQDQLEMLKSQVKFAYKSIQNGTEEDIKTTIDEISSKSRKIKELPEIEADLCFEAKDFLTGCRQYGQIKVNPADPSKSYAEIDAVKIAILNEETTLSVYALNKEGKKNIYTSASTDKFTSKVVASGKIIESKVERKLGTNESLVIFTSNVRGMNQVLVKMNEENIRNIPCPVYVYTPTPSNMIKVQCPNMIAVTAERIVIVGDASEHVNIYSKEGNVIRSFMMEGEKNPGPRGLATDGEFLFVTDKTNNCVKKYDFEGNLIRSVGIKGSKQLEFSGRCGIAVDKKTKRVYIADQYNHRIQVLDSDLNFVRIFGTRGYQEREFDRPRSVAVADNSTVYVADTNNDRVQVFKGSGEYIREFGKDQLSSPAGICVDLNDHVLVADHDNHRICVFNPEGEFLFSFGESGNKPGEFTDVFGIAVDSDGVIYTADFGSDRVQIF